eukprot:3934318-Rhodomonas_salina.3
MQKDTQTECVHVLSTPEASGSKSSYRRQEKAMSKRRRCPIADAQKLHRQSADLPTSVLDIA